MSSTSSRIRPLLMAILFALVLIPFLPLPGLLAGSGSVSAGNASGDRGDTINITISLASGADIQSFGFNVNWDPNILTYVSTSQGSVIPSGWNFGANPKDAGSVIIGGFATGGAAINGNGTIATITFTIKQTATYGSSKITISDAKDDVSKGGDGTVTVQPGAAINAFDADPDTIAQGESATLSWNISNATSASINNGVGTVSATSGSKQVSPTETTTYTLTATGASGTKTATATVTVSKVPRPVIASFTVSPSAVVSGQTVTFSFAISGANSATIDNGVGSVNKNGGTATAKPKVDTTYTLTAKNAGGETTASVSVKVIKEPIINWFSASTAANSPINAGEKGFLGWGVLGADTVTIDKGVGPVDKTSGSVVVGANQTTTYLLTASNGAGTSTAQATLFVTDKPRIRSFTANPAAIIAGEAANLKWSVAGATSIELHPGFGPVFGSNGARGVVPGGTTAYTLIARNGSGETSASATVEVVDNASDLEISLGAVAGKVSLVSPADTGLVLGSGPVGVPVEFSLTVVNIGAGDGRPCALELFANGASVAGARIPALGPGESRTLKFPWTPLFAGATPIEIIVDSLSQNPDMDRSNNVISGDFIAQKTTGTDLVISEVDVTRPQISGLKNVLQVSFRITNVGDKAAGSFRYAAYLTKSAKAPTSKDTIVVQGEISAMQASGDSVLVTRTIVLRKIPNTFWFQGMIDTLNQVNEVSETNNTALQQYSRTGLATQ